MTSLAKVRTVAFDRQEHRCHYCGHPMWQLNKRMFAKQYGLTLREANMHRCTAEHLKARSEGGRNNIQNIVAACYFCNHKRHENSNPLAPNAYGKYVKNELRLGRWHGHYSPHSAPN